MNENKPFEVPGIPVEEVEEARKKAQKEIDTEEERLKNINVPHGRSVKDLLEMDVNIDNKGGK